MEIVQNRLSNLKLVDLFIIFIMGTIAACGLVYEYAISHFAARVIGSMEIVIFSIISIMIVSMGVGAFLAQKIKEPFFAFSLLESIIAITAVIGIFVIAGGHTFAYSLPEILAEHYNISYDMAPKGGFISAIEMVMTSTSFIVAGILGVLIGMEIPLMARIREIIHAKHLEHNAGMIYGADYIGAGFGAAVWVFFLIKQDISFSIAVISSTNVIAGFIFLFFFKPQIKRFKTLMTIQVLSIFIITFGAMNIGSWQKYLEDSLYNHKLVYTANTDYQHIAVTKGINSDTREPFYNFFINGKTQFSQNDEAIYHSLLVTPAMLAADRNKDVLIIGGGDGLAARDVFKYNPDSITLLDLDPKIVDFFKSPVFDEEGNQINKAMIKLNENAFNDKRMKFIFGDAFVNLQKLILQNKKYDVIIVDLPDPSHPDLNKMYSKAFYYRLNNVLNEGGTISIQSTSPYSAKKVFMSIKKTLENSGFNNVEQLHRNVPSFGEWGWTVAKKDTKSVFNSIKYLPEDSIKNGWLTKDLMLGSFAFGKNFYKDYDKIQVNNLGSGNMYEYYNTAWKNSILFRHE